MALLESIRVALTSIWANKLRALLTMLGVIIGVSSVIIMISIVQGLRQKIVGQFAGNGANLIFAAYAPKPGSKTRGNASLTMRDVEAVRRQCTLVQDVSPSVTFSTDAHVADKRQSITMVGALPDYPDVNNVTLASGRFFTDDENAAAGRVCIIGDKVRQELFPGANAVRQELVCDYNGTNIPLSVIGVLAEKDRTGMSEDYNSSVIVPFRSAQVRFTGSEDIRDFVARSTDVSQTEAAADQVWAIIKQRHRLNYRDYIVDTQEGLLKQIDVVIGVMQIALGGIAGLSLLTGGIGIMNIMLVSVTERTREIGIRKAVGATRGAILMQFVVEAMLVAAIGGLIGTLIGYGVSSLINTVSHGKLPTFIPFWAVGLGVGFAASVGLFFGIYPAYRASKLDPIQALRYE